VDHVEDASTQVPMVSRILQLLMVDILAVGVAMRRPVPVPAPPAQAASSVAASSVAASVGFEAGV
jgi:glucokinase